MEIYKKYFSEIIYPGQIEIYEGIKNIIKLFYPKKFGHWTIDNKSVMKLHQVIPFEDSKEKLIIEHKKFLYSIENPSTENFFCDKFLSNFKLIEKYIESNIYNRLGIRNFTKIGPINFEDYIKRSKDNLIFSKSFSKYIDELTDFSDIQIVLQSSDCRILSGPMKKDEKNYYTENFVDNEIMQCDYILFDIDCFETNFNSNSFRQVFKQTYNKLQNIEKSLIDYFGELINE